MTGPAGTRPRPAATPAAGRGAKLRRLRAWLLGVPLFWRVYVTNALMLGLAFAGLILAPVTVSAPVAATELVLLAAGLAVLLAVNLLLLRPAFGPFQELAETMRRHDPLSPGARARLVGGPDVVAIAQAFNEMLDRLEAERRESARHALTAQEDERRRIARELHDEVGQTLTGVILQVEGLSATIPETLRPQLDELRETARHGTQEVRRIARQLRPEALEELGLQSAIAVLATTFSEQTRIPVERRLEAAPALSKEQELVVYRVAQEAMTNVARHAQASHVELRFERRGDWMVLAVRDDGRGIRPEELASSNGVRGMRERAMLIGAQLSIDAAVGGGTEVRLRIPLDRINRTGACAVDGRAVDLQVGGGATDDKPSVTPETPRDPDGHLIEIGQRTGILRAQTR